MDDSLEALLEKATNPRNTYEDWEFIMAFCDKVNLDQQGPVVTLRIVVPKMRSDNEKVALLSLTLLEACVKNCGQRFHQELGKFKFLNELIRMISPKYLGDSTFPQVKDKITRLLYSWKIGLPQEGKINEAYLMLKREGLIFDESSGPDGTLEPDAIKPKVTLIEDPKQSQMLQKLLASKNPEDLRAANRLIRDMVRRDEKRMQKLQKRLEEVDLIQNNVKLLNELLSHLKDDSGDVEKQLIDELYKSIDKMRPSLFRMASELKQNEEGMSEILRTNDSVTHVMELYRTKRGTPSDSGQNGDGASGGEGVAASSSSATAASESGGQAAEVTSTVNGTDTAGDNSLIDLADLNFDPMPLTGAVGGGGASSDLNYNTGFSSLMDDLSALDLGTPTASNLGLGASPLGNTLFGGMSGGVVQPFSLSGGVPGPATMATQFPGAVPVISSTPMSSGSPSSSIQPSLITIPPPPQHQARMGVAQVRPQGNPVPGMAQTGMGIAAPMGMEAVTNTSNPRGLSISESVWEELYLAPDGIRLGPQPPMEVMKKDSIVVTFHFAKNVPAPDVSVILVTIANTGDFPTSDIEFQAAVPKMMRVKLLVPTARHLDLYYPLLGRPPSLSQVMFLSNPMKVNVRMKYRVQYKQLSLSKDEVTEFGEVGGFPQP